MFVDRVRIKVTAGAGGDGCCSFRREKYVPFGGPNGGDGGDGGDVFFVATSRLTTLLDLRYHSTWKGKRGVHGKGSDCHGKNGEELVVPVPCGTLVRSLDTGDILADLTEDRQRFRAARGGKGGKGNARFASSTNRVPRFCEKGEPGEEREYVLELKLIAEVGFVGLPNAGKSTLLARISAARPKIADYPFTTLSPNLGVVPLDGYRTLTVADIPGLIEGAAQGKGLGHDFLRHIERTKVLLFLLDLGDPDPLKTRAILERELAQHSPEFAKRPHVHALNKIDVTENRNRFERLKDAFQPVHGISGVTGEGVAELLERLWQGVDAVRKEEAGLPAPGAADREYTFKAPYDIVPVADGFRIKGERILQVVHMTDFGNPEAVDHFQHTIKKMGVFKALKRLGAREGQTITIGELQLEYHPD